ncbi:unnamed protein product [Orchesella dallaii]|uniref:C-type lectin domain-containing protein n=1 Tax=Orchesella dallaii TaxID=48710 RepID=A0ABP1RH00_9HEXA
MTPQTQAPGFPGIFQILDPEIPETKKLENETYFWTGGSSKFESFEWKWATNLLIDREYELNTEYCIVAHVSSGSDVKIMDYPCENAFPFSCEDLDSNPCFYGEWDEIQIDYKGAKRYLYIPTLELLELFLFQKTWNR